VYETIAALVTRMEADLERLAAAGDTRRFFHGTCGPRAPSRRRSSAVASATAPRWN
jgi:hypothetical protein